jgi:hypothetical protein
LRQEGVAQVLETFLDAIAEVFADASALFDGLRSPFTNSILTT